MGVTPGDGRRNDRSSEGEFVKPKSISKEVMALARAGWNACYYKDKAQLEQFRASKEHLLVSKVLPIFRTSYYFCACSDLSLLYEAYDLKFSG